MNNTESLHAQKHSYYLERSRYAILNFGYDLIVFKSKAKKSLVTLKKQITTFHP